MRIIFGVLVLTLLGCAGQQPASGSSFPAGHVGDMQATHSGFFDLSWDESQGKLFLHIAQFDAPFIYQTSLARGIGSNDLGADRGRLGDTKLVEFYRSGSRVLLVENNTAYRAESSNVDERNAVAESFARSVLWGFSVVSRRGNGVIVDATDFFLRDPLALAAWLEGMAQGSFAVDNSRSAIFLPRTRSFVDNTEVEAILTLTGTPKGDILDTVVPDSTAITVHTHHSFVRLPDAGYEPLAFDPRSGFLDPAYAGGYFDYAVPIGEAIGKAHVRRHRLARKDPTAQVGEAVEPIVYYLDRGAPEPIRGALLDGARWWDQAFAAAGYRNAFRVELLPPGADPMDVRYNVIQWVHRSTRGWSYGSSVVDPRTGEILKGHVSLGSLRVRQDFMLAEGLLAPYGDDDNPAMQAFALARIRQLSAHEVGHTLGLEHNFAASANRRASVMDYPFPLIRLSADGAIDLTDAYAVGIGEWDKRAIIWGYQQFAPGVDAAREREKIIDATFAAGLEFVADVHARAVGAAHASGSLWDNGADPVVELKHLLRVRAQVIDNFSAANIRAGRPMATLEEVLVPMYLLHRFQIQAVGKLLGGGDFRYDLKGDGQRGFEPVSQKRQAIALAALLETLAPKMLALPESLVQQISPRPPGFARGRETFARDTGPLFDPFAPADAAIGLTLDVLLEPSRGARLIANKSARPGDIGLVDVIDRLLQQSLRSSRQQGVHGEIQRRLNYQIIERLSLLANGEAVPASVRSVAWMTLEDIHTLLLSAKTPSDPMWRAHDVFAKRQLQFVLEHSPAVLPIDTPAAPPGSPIGQAR